MKTSNKKIDADLINEKAVKTIETDTLSIAYIDHGEADGWPVILSHGFPYDVHAYDEVAKILVKKGARVIAPYTRGYGPTRFLSKDTMRNAQQVARASDLIAFSRALGLERPIIGGFDWGGNASCVAAALWPEEIGGLISYAGYDIIDIGEQKQAFPPLQEHVCWYQHLFQSERGRECLAKNRYEIGKMLWKEWSPHWKFHEATYAKTATAFDNPDFVNIVIHCYRFMHGKEGGDPALQHLEDLLAKKPMIKVPAVTIDGKADPLKPEGTAEHTKFFEGPHVHVVSRAGHNVPQEAPRVFANAVLKVHSWLVK